MHQCSIQKLCVDSDSMIQAIEMHDAETRGPVVREVGDGPGILDLGPWTWERRKIVKLIF